MTGPFGKTALRWLPAAALAHRLPPEQAGFLLTTGSLTRRLEQACSGRLGVTLLGQQRGRPRVDEAVALKQVEGAWSLIRRVRLSCGEEPWVYARTAIPAATLERHRTLGHLGERPLGAALFSMPRMTRGPLELARLEPGTALHQEAGGGTRPRWARRSVFCLDGAPLLVCEVFNEVAE